MLNAVALEIYLIEGKEMAKKVTIGNILSVAQTREEELLAKENVIGVGAGFRRKEKEQRDFPEELCLKVFVSRKLPEEEIPEPSRVDGSYDEMPTDVETMEPPFAFGPLKQKVRPALGGYSVGHYKITAGTIATCVRGGYWGQQKFYILSNNHVLANSNNASLGDPILQPGPYDGGTNPDDRIARLSKFVPIVFSWTAKNLVDAAIAEVDISDSTREIYWLGCLKGWRKKKGVKLYTKVQKTGRTTGYTLGYISALNATVLVNYGYGRIARFVDQIVIRPGGFSAPGDSGSLVTDLDEIAVGLLFAGSATHTIANQIEHVRSLLGVYLSEKGATP